MSAAQCQGCLDICVGATMRHAGSTLLLIDGHTYFMLDRQTHFGFLCRYDDQLLQLTVSCLYLSAMVGALGSELSRPLGRKVKIQFALARHTHLSLHKLLTRISDDRVAYQYAGLLTGPHGAAGLW